MPIRNLKDLLIEATKLPATLEATLPEGLPKLSATLVNVAATMPDMPDFPMAVPDLPIPEMPAGLALPPLKPLITGVEVKKEVPPAPAPRRIIPFVFE